MQGHSLILGPCKQGPGTTIVAPHSRMTVLILSLGHPPIRESSLPASTPCGLFVGTTIVAPVPPNPAGWLKGIEPRPARRRLASMSRQGCHATGTGTLSFPPRSILVIFILAYKNELPLQNHATLLRGMIHSSGMAHRCKSPSRFLQARTDATIVASCDPFSRLASVQMLSHRHASGLTLVPYLEPSISQVALPQWSVTAPLAIDPRARAGSSKAGHLIKTRED